VTDRRLNAVLAGRLHVDHIGETGHPRLQILRVGRRQIGPVDRRLLLAWRGDPEHLALGGRERDIGRRSPRRRVKAGNRPNSISRVLSSCSASRPSRRSCGCRHRAPGHALAARGWNRLRSSSMAERVRDWGYRQAIRHERAVSSFFRNDDGIYLLCNQMLVPLFSRNFCTESIC
jgi:hypothetical protein